ncbi:MAG: hypothetical protein ACXAC8_01990 [Candidatus Hodarchaeales archaeon]
MNPRVHKYTGFQAPYNHFIVTQGQRRHAGKFKIDNPSAWLSG